MGRSPGGAVPLIASLIYHEITDDPATSGFQRASALPYKHTRAAFARHLDEIAASPCVPELVTAVDFAASGRHLLLTFDDGGRSASYVSEELSRRGWFGHFFIVTSLIGSRTFLSASDIREIRSRGHIIGTHTHTHPDIFREQPVARMLEEWRTSCARLADLLGEPCTVGSVPGGDVSRAVFESAGTAGVRFLFTSEPWLRPRRVAGCWILGRGILKTTTLPTRVGELARFRGWARALFARRMKVLLCTLFPYAYRYYIRRTAEKA